MSANDTDNLAPFGKRGFVEARRRRKLTKDSKILLEKQIGRQRARKGGKEGWREDKCRNRIWLWQIFSPQPAKDRFGSRKTTPLSAGGGHFSGANMERVFS